MGWRDLLHEKSAELIAPWIGGRSLCTFDRSWKIESKLPQEHGWHKFSTSIRTAAWIEPADMPNNVLREINVGYLVGDRLIPDTVSVTPQLKDLAKFEKVHLIEQGLDRFVRISAGRFFEGGPLVYNGLEMPIGPEDGVLHAFLDEKETVNNIPGVIPALDAAFLIETWRRNEAKRIRQEEEIRREKEEKRKKILNSLGDGAGRREVALLDFATAAKAALAVGGAQYLDHRDSTIKGEAVVRFRLNNGRFECTCNKATLRIMDAGICLTDHDSGEKGDTFFTLESLPAVILQAQKEHKLVIFRHAG